MYEGITPSVDLGFVKKLKEFDSELRCVFNRDLERFVIEQPRVIGGWAIACVVRSEDDTHFAYPDNRHIAILYEADFQRHNPDQRVKEGEDYMREFREKEESDARQEIHERTVDDKNQLMNALKKQYNLGKGVTGYRQVPIKSKGYKVEDRRKLKPSV